MNLKSYVLFLAETESALYFYQFFRYLVLAVIAID